MGKSKLVSLPEAIWLFSDWANEPCLILQLHCLGVWTSSLVHCIKLRRCLGYWKIVPLAMCLYRPIFGGGKWMPLSCAVMLVGKDDFPLSLLLFQLFIIALRKEGCTAYELLWIQCKTVLPDLTYFKLNNPMAMLWHYSINMLYLIHFLHIDFVGHLLMLV